MTVTVMLTASAIVSATAVSAVTQSARASAIGASRIDKIRRIARLAASVNGDPVPRQVQVVMTGGREGIAAAAPGGSFPATNREAVFVISMTGHFVGYGFRNPPGTAAPKGSFLDMVVDARTLRVMAISMPLKPTNVGALGRPLSLSWKKSATVTSTTSPDCSDRCYGVAQWDPSNKSTGSQGVVTAHCLWVHDPTTNFVDAEMWQGTDNSTVPAYWIEAGETYGWPFGAKRGWFYERWSPVNGRGDFYPSGTPDLDQPYYFAFTYLGDPNNDPQWQINAPWGNPTIYEEPLYGKFLQAGTEITEANNRDVGTVIDLAYKDASGSWHTGWPGSVVMDTPTPPDTTTTWTGTGAIYYHSSC